MSGMGGEESRGWSRRLSIRPHSNQEDESSVWQLYEAVVWQLVNRRVSDDEYLRNFYKALTSEKVLWVTLDLVKSRPLA